MASTSKLHNGKRMQLVNTLAILRDSNTRSREARKNLPDHEYNRRMELYASRAAEGRDLFTGQLADIADTLDDLHSGKISSFNAMADLADLTR